MLPLCYFCLRTDVKLRILGSLPEDRPELISFCDQLCDYNFQDFFYQFCPECIAKLSKFLDFKNQCKLAGNLIKSWKETSVSERIPMNKLYKHVPLQSQAHFFQEDKPKTLVQTNRPIYVTVDSPNENNINITHKKQKLFLEIASETNTSKDASETNYMYNVEIKNKVSDDESSINDLNGSGDDELGLSGDELGLSVDENGSSGDGTYLRQKCDKINKTVSDDENIPTIYLYKDGNALEKLDRKRVSQSDYQRMKADTKSLKKIPEPDRIKEYLCEKLTKLNDKDFDSIINCLDKMPQCFLRLCARAIGAGPISESKINKLLKVHAHFVDISSVFDIDILSDYQQAQAEFERRREYPEYVKSVHRCEICLVGYKSQQHLNNHCRIFHDVSHPHVCELCKCRFKTNSLLTCHYTRIHQTVYRCKRCPHIFHLKESMEHHFRKHEGLKFKCKICSKEFQHKCMYYAHLTKHKQIVPTVHCEFCAFSSHSLTGMKLHKMRLHNGENLTEKDCNKKCDECNTTFISDDVYAVHIKRMHKDKKARRIVNQKPKVMKCRLCNAPGTGNRWLVIHFQRDHPTEDMRLVYGTDKKYLCNECGKMFKSKSILADHMNTHTQIKPYSCAECSKTFHTKHRLCVHMERHKEPVHCQICDKEFRSTSNLRNHVLIHINNRCHKCGICDKGFISRAHLKEHVRGVHLNIKRTRKKLRKLNKKDTDSE